MDETKANHSSRHSEVHDFDRSVSLGERSLGYLKQFRTPAIPRNYEIFYVHSAGYNPELSAAIRRAVADHACLTEDDAEEIYSTYLRPAEQSEQVGEVSGQVSEEIKEIVTTLTTAVQTTGNYGSSLKGLSDQLGDISNPAQLKTVVESLVKSTNDMCSYNRDLESRLARSQRQIEDLHQSLETIRTESLTDQLTGLSNRKRFDQVVEMEMAEAATTNEPLCLLIMDIDFFKSFNDKYGHQTGDQVLRLVAHTLKTSVKGRDHTARYGGEEFVILLPQTPLDAAATVAEHIRKAIRAKELIKKSTGESLGRITISVGIATYRPGETVEDWVQRADACLYAAKRAGRDQVKCETEVPPDSVEAA